jgi:hypothetical protein
MALNTIIITIAAIILGIWIIFGFKRMRHKMLALFLIALVLFSFFSFNSAFKEKDFSINSLSDLGTGMKIYLSWFVNIFGNLKTLSGQVIKMDWEGNSTS